MSSIVVRSGHVGPPTYQAKIRKVGYPLLSRTFKQREHAEAWAASVEAAIDARNAARSVDIDIVKAASEAPHDRITLGDLLQRYREEVTPRKGGAEVERLRIGAILRHPISACAVAYLTAVQAAAWRDARLKTVKGATVRRERNVLRHVIETARREWGIKLESNPFQVIYAPKDSAPRERRLRPGEEERLLTACTEARNPYLLSVVLLALETAMRQSEIVSLEWDRVNIDKRYLHLLHTKNGESRGVPLSTRAVAVLESMPGERKGKVFGVLSAEAIKRAFIRATKRAELKDFRFHDLRHEATSRFFEQGRTLAEVATITGHKTWAMLRRYTHLQLGDLARKLG